VFADQSDVPANVKAVPPPDLVVEEEGEVIAPPEVAPLAGLARTQYEGSGLFEVDAAALPPEESAPVDLPLIMPEEAEAEARSRRSTPMEAPRTEPRRPSAPAPLIADDDGAVDHAALSAAEPLVTETMAELYRRQGHLDDARRVYRELIERSPGDARLAAKLAELEGRPAPARRGQAVPAFLRALYRGEPLPEPAAAPAPAPLPGSVLDEAFEHPEAAVPAAAPAGDGAGAPTQPAPDAFSLDSVFGDSRDSEGMAAPEPEVAPAAPRPSGFSFDEFFGGGEKVAEAPDAPGGAPARPSGRAARAQEPEADLDQFQTWLRGLKS
jgi:hypothetical protein